MYKKVKLQQREYVGADGISKYKQCRINIPHSIIQKIGWTAQDQITISIEPSSTRKKDKERIILIVKDSFYSNEFFSCPF